MAFGTRLPFPLPRPFGTVDAEPELVGSAAGVATATGALTLEKELAGTSAGVATVTATLLVATTNELASTPAGIATASSTLSVFILLAGQSDGTATVSGHTHYHYLYSTIAGVATVTAGSLTEQAGAGYPIPYPFLAEDIPAGGPAMNLLDGVAKGRSTNTGTLTQVFELAGSSAGVATVTGVISLSGTPLLSASQINGIATVTAFLSNGLLDDDGDFIIELAGTADGVATVTNTGFIHTQFLDNPSIYLYQIHNVGVGFDDTDDVSGRSGFVSQSYTDGDTVADFDRYLYQLHNVGVGFDDTDDVSLRSDFVSQSYPDGDNVIDWDRYLYQLVNVLNLDPVAFGTVVINEGFSGGSKFVNDPAPPGQKL